MANILSVLAKAADEEILRQVATLEVVTIRNIVGTEGMKAVDKAAGLVNSVGRMLGAKKRLVKDVQPRSIAEQIEERMAERDGDSREKLDEELRQLLAERLSLTEDSSDEQIAGELVDCAADYLGLEEVLTPAETADEVFEGYRRRLEEKLGAAAEEGPEGIRQQLEQAQEYGLWQYMRSLSGVDGEICCRLVLLAGCLHGRPFAAQETDLPDWLTGRDEEAQQELMASDESYQAREAELKEARAGQAEAEKKLRAAIDSEKAARGALSQHQAYLVRVREQVENFETNKLNAEIQLGVLEGQLVMAARAEKNSARTINKLKKAVLSQRKAIAELKACHEENLITLEQAPERESQLRQLIEQAGEETAGKKAALQEAEEILAAAREAREAERRERREYFSRRLADWQQQVIGGRKCEFEETFLNQLAMTGGELHEAVLKAVWQLWEAESPGDFGEQVSEDSWRLPLRGTGLFLIYEAGREGGLTFRRFTEAGSLAELQREREEAAAGGRAKQAPPPEED